MPAKLTTTVSKIAAVPNRENAALLDEYYRYLKAKGASDNHINNCLKTAMAFAIFLGPDVPFSSLTRKEQVLAFLDTKVKNNDPEKRWIATWNHYLRRIKMFYRWLFNTRIDPKEQTGYGQDEGWVTPSFVRIRERPTKRLSPYSETEIWERDELLLLVRYVQNKRDKAALTLFWDLDARNHEVTLLKIKHIRLKEQYGEGEIPHEAKTGSGPILLTCSFPFVRDWLNEHPLRNDPEARLICSIRGGGPIGPEAMWTMMKSLRQRVIRMLEKGEIADLRERERLEYLLKTKKWNPYCLRHSAITADSDFLPEYALKKKVRWSMNSKQGSRYIKRTMGNELKRQILERSGIIVENTLRPKPAVENCPKCSYVNAFESKFCSRCSYPLRPEGYDELKVKEKETIKSMEERHRRDMESFKTEVTAKIQELLNRVDTSKLSPP